MAVETAGIREKRNLVERVSKSSTFQRSPRLREFLLYVAECSLEERLEGTREQQIAENVFNRKPDYNPGQDNIVRVEARSLRKRLEVYFATEGKDEPIVLSMPKGSYAICFEPRPPEPDTALPHIAEPIQSPGTASQSWQRSPWLVGIACAVAGVLIGISVAVIWPTRAPGGVSRPPAPPRSLPFSALIEPARDTYLVTSDSGAVLIQDLRQKRFLLDDYITGRYQDDSSSPSVDSGKQSLIRTLVTRRYTNAAETAIAGKIILRNSWFSQRMFLRSGHGVQLSDFKDQNAILFGSPISNPWAGLFSEKLNFQFDWDAAHRGQFINRAPLPGEQPLYSMRSNAGESGSAYAVVAFVPNVNGEGHVLLVAGTTAEGTEAAGEFITDDKRTAAALKALAIDPDGPPRYFEILLEAKTIAGSASQSTVLASRVVSDTK